MTAESKNNLLERTGYESTKEIIMRAIQTWLNQNTRKIETNFLYDFRYNHSYQNKIAISITHKRLTPLAIIIREPQLSALEQNLITQDKYMEIKGRVISILCDCGFIFLRTVDGHELIKYDLNHNRICTRGDNERTSEKKYKVIVNSYWISNTWAKERIIGNGKSLRKKTF